MTLRTNLTNSKRWAHSILDQVRAGLPVSAQAIRRALIVLGDVT